MFENNPQGDVADDVELDQPDTDTAEQDDETTATLPTDQEALRAHAEQLAASDLKARREAKALRKENERLEETRKELEATRDYQRRLLERGGQSDAPAKGRESADTKPARTDLKTVLAGIDLAPFVTSDNGVAELVEVLEEKGVIVTAARLEKILDERVAKESQTNVALQGIAREFPEVAEEGSDLQVMTSSELNKIMQERPNLDYPTQFELATRRAAQRLQIDPNQPARKTAPTNAKQPATTDRTRLRNAQAGPVTGRNGGNQPIAATLNASDLRAAKQMGLTEAQALDAKKGVVAVASRQQARR